MRWSRTLQGNPEACSRTRWHKWFAWYPVELFDEWVWLETIWRKGERYGGGFGETIWIWQYDDPAEPYAKELKL